MNEGCIPSKNAFKIKDIRVKYVFSPYSFDETWFWSLDFNFISLVAKLYKNGDFRPSSCQKHQ